MAGSEAERYRLAQEVKRLTLPEQMGERFKVGRSCAAEPVSKGQAVCFRRRRVVLFLLAAILFTQAAKSYSKAISRHAATSPRARRALSMAADPAADGLVACSSADFPPCTRLAARTT